MTEQEEMEAILDVFTTPGWKLILRDMQELCQNIDTVQGIDTNNQFWKRQGEVDRLGWFIHLEDWYRFMQENTLADIDDTL